MNNLTKILQDAREASDLSYEQIAYELRDRLGPYAPVAGTIRNYHSAVPKRPDLMLLFALADVYGLEASVLVGEKLDGIRELVARSRCFAVSAGQPIGGARDGPH